MATQAQVEAWIKQVTYKPGWTFRLHADPMNRWDLVSIYLEDKTADADGEREWARVGSVVTVPPFIEDQEHFLRWLWQMLVSREKHEALEWLRFGGQRAFAAHGEGTSYESPTHYQLS